MKGRLSTLLALLVLISLIVISNYSLAGQEGVVETKTYYAGVEAIKVFTRGSLTVLVVYPNPEVLFSYRNAYVVLDETIWNWKFLVTPELKPVLMQRLNEMLELIKTALLAGGVSLDEVEFEGIYIYIDLSNKPVDRIVESIFRVIGDTNVTLTIYDKRLKELWRLFVDADVSAKLTPPFGIMRDLHRQMINELKARGCYADSGLIVVKVSPVLRGWDYLMDVLLNATDYEGYRECLVIVERYVRELVDIAREYVPEDIPLFIGIRWAPGVKVIIEYLRDLPPYSRYPPVPSTTHTSKTPPGESTSTVKPPTRTTLTKTTPTSVERLEQPLNGSRPTREHNYTMGYSTSTTNSANNVSHNYTLALALAIPILASVALVITLRRK